MKNILNKNSQNLSQCFFEFIIPDQERFQHLSYVFNTLKQEKQTIFAHFNNISNEENDDEEQLAKENIQKRDEVAENLFILFDDRALAHFWWPTQQEKDVYWQKWETTPLPQRFTDPALQTPWDFLSMIDSLLTGEYEFISCDLLVPSDKGMLVFLPYSFPYGSSDAIKVFIESFDCTITGANLGDGYISYE